jgi:SagB-type dehydrogenase family enzyme
VVVHRLNRHLLIYSTAELSRRRLVIDLDSRAPALVVDDPRLISGLLLLPSVFTRDEATSLWTDAFDDPDVAAAMWTFCVEMSVIVGRDEASSLAITRGYHAVTRSYPFLDMSAAGAMESDNALMRSYAAVDLGPSPFFESNSIISRVPLRKAHEVQDLTLFADRLSLVFDGIFGQRLRARPFLNRKIPYLQLELLFKAVPSGGARHPTECFAYIVPPRFGDQEPDPIVSAGLYHYNVRDNALHQMKSGKVLIDTLNRSGVWLERIESERESIVFLLASRVERAMWRYRDPRSFRAVIIDVGHVIQQIVEYAALLGYSYVEHTNVDRDGIGASLGLDRDLIPVVSVGTMSA